MHRTLCTLIAAALTLAFSAPVPASEAELPAGPIRDRHELMEDIGANAKKIGNAMKTGAKDQIAAPAKAIRDATPRVLPLFPEGSTHPNSRALEAIWKDWASFQRANTEMEKAATDLAAAAESGGDLPPAVKRLFDSCKSCHDSFRAPEE